MQYGYINFSEDEIHFLLKFVQRFSDDHPELGDDHFENMSNLLKKGTYCFNGFVHWISLQGTPNYNAYVIII